jgi:ABC-type lipoprotein release transport system permease subunit
MLILAWKNIWRNRRRSLVILASTALGLAAGLVAVGMMTGMYDAMISSAINRGLGDLQVHASAWKAEESIECFLPAPDSLLRAIRADPGVRSCAGHTRIEAMISSPTTSSGVQIIGIDPEEESRVTAIGTSLREGTYLDRQNVVVIGEKLAGKLKLKLRSRVVLSFAGLDGAILYGAFRVSGIYRTDASTFDAVNVFVRQQDLSPLLGAAAPIHEIIVRTRANTDPLQVRSRLQSAMPGGVVIETWKDISPELKLTVESSDLVNIILLAIILFALLFGLTNTLLMSVLDRIRDFGVLLAVGMFRRRLFAMILLESVLLSLTGGVIGVVVGWGVTDFFHARGIDLSAVSAGLSAYGIPTMLYPFIRPSVYGLLAGMVLATSMLAALYPAVKAVRLKPVQAIRTIG